MLARHGDDAPFRAAIMLSSAYIAHNPTPNYTIFNNFANASGCTQEPGPDRLACLRNITGETIRNFTNSPDSGLFGTPIVDKWERIHIHLLLYSANRFGSVL